MNRSQYEDSTPDDVFIKVYPARLRRIIREKHIRRAEIGELLLLALGIDENNTSLQSKNESVREIGMNSPQWARKVQTNLKEKGVIDWEIDPQANVPRFKLPDAFAPGERTEPAYGLTQDDLADLTDLLGRLMTALERNPREDQ